VKDRVLIIEDEPAISRGLCDVFRQNGFEVLAALDGDAGLEAALTQRPDVILLDVMLPRMNGFEICRAARDANVDAPSLMLTAKGQEADVVLGLSLGADDYITKPFRIAELLARVRAFLRRHRAASEPLCRFGDCEVNLRARTVARNGHRIALTAKEFKLLEYLVGRPGCALARDTILNVVWGRSVFVGPRSVDRCVTTLRAKIEPDPRHPRFIQTIRDIGYRFEPGDEGTP
jgi:DNA-binding response OmpR family regulator